LLPEPLESGELIINLRAEADPEALKMAVLQSLGASGEVDVVARVEHIEHFRPGKPQPTHRLASAYRRKTPHPDHLPCVQDSRGGKDGKLSNFLLPLLVCTGRP
jgi:hypothetical protein